MRFVQFAAHVPDDLCLTSLREVIALNEVQVHACFQERLQRPSLRECASRSRGPEERLGIL